MFRTGEHPSNTSLIVREDVGCGATLCASHFCTVTINTMKLCNMQVLDIRSWVEGTRLGVKLPLPPMEKFAKLPQSGLWRLDCRVCWTCGSNCIWTFTRLSIHRQSCFCDDWDWSWPPSAIDLHAKERVRNRRSIEFLSVRGNDWGTTGHMFAWATQLQSCYPWTFASMKLETLRRGKRRVSNLSALHGDCSALRRYRDINDHVSGSINLSRDMWKSNQIRQLRYQI